MSIDIVRAWRDADYFAALSPEQQDQVPDNPAGSIDLSFADLQKVSGARAAASCTGSSCCSCHKTKACSSCDSAMAVGAAKGFSAA